METAAAADRDKEPLGDLTAWYTVGVLTLAYVVSIADRQLLSLLIEPIRRDLAISDTEISLLAGLAFALFYTLLGIPIGRLADRKSRKMIISAGILVWSFMTASSGLARTFMHLLLARVGVGVGEAALSPSAHSMITDSFPPQQLGRAFGVYTMGSSFGTGLALVGGGAVVAFVDSLASLDLSSWGLGQPWRVAFVLMGLPGLLVAALMLTVREPVRRGRLQRPAPGSAGGASSSQPALPFRDTWTFLKHHANTYLPLYFGFSLVGLILLALLTWVPTMFIRTYGWRVPEIGLVFGLLLLVFGGFGAIAGGLYADWLRRRGFADAPVRATLAGLVVLVPSAAIMPITGSAPCSLFFLALALVPLFGIGTLIPTALQSITPNEFRAQVSALGLFFLNLIGAGLGPTLVALVTDYGFHDAMALRYSISIVVVVVGPLSAFILLRGIRSFGSRAEQYAPQIVRTLPSTD